MWGLLWHLQIKHHPTPHDDLHRIYYLDIWRVAHNGNRIHAGYAADRHDKDNRRTLQEFIRKDISYCLYPLRAMLYLFYMAGEPSRIANTAQSD